MNDKLKYEQQMKEDYESGYEPCVYHGSSGWVSDILWFIGIIIGVIIVIGALSHYLHI